MLPENGQTWPPETIKPTLDRVAEWAAWYSSDPDRLYEHYRGTLPVDVRNHPAQFRGGVQGRIARWWWGEPVPAGERRTKVHVPLAGDIATASADLLFSEAPTFTGDNDTLQDWLDSLLDDGLVTTLQEGAEVAAGLSGAYLRVTWDSDVAATPWPQVVHPDGAIPTFRWGRLAAVLFWHIVAQDGAAVYRLFEDHQPGSIEYALYEGTMSNVGVRVPLQEQEASAHLADLVNADGVQETLTDRLTAQYVPNILPNRLDRGSPQGRSDYQGVTPLFDALDEAYSSWLRDIRLGKARLHIPETYLDTDGPGTPGQFDLDRELYVPVHALTPKDKLQIDAQQFTIRYQEHADTCRDWTRQALQSAGYSPQTFGMGDVGAATATEIRANERRSYMTRGKKIRLWRQALLGYLQTAADITNAHLAGGVSPGDIGIEFGDTIHDGPLQLSQTLQALSVAEAASTEVKVRMLHPDWPDDEVQDEVNRIRSESAVPDPTDLGL